MRFKSNTYMYEKEKKLIQQSSKLSYRTVDISLLVALVNYDSQEFNKVRMLKYKHRSWFDEFNKYVVGFPINLSKASKNDFDQSKYMILKSFYQFLKGSNKIIEKETLDKNSADLFYVKYKTYFKKNDAKKVEIISFSSFMKINKNLIFNNFTKQKIAGLDGVNIKKSKHCYTLKKSKL